MTKARTANKSFAVVGETATFDSCASIAQPSQSPETLWTTLNTDNHGKFRHKIST